MRLKIGIPRYVRLEYKCGMYLRIRVWSLVAVADTSRSLKVNVDDKFGAGVHRSVRLQVGAKSGTIVAREAPPGKWPPQTNCWARMLQLRFESTFITMNPSPSVHRVAAATKRATAAHQQHTRPVEER